MTLDPSTIAAIVGVVLWTSGFFLFGLGLGFVYASHAMRKKLERDATRRDIERAVRGPFR